MSQVQENTITLDKAERLFVDLGARSYDIIIGPGLLSTTGSLVAELSAERKAFLITDENVAKTHLPTVESSLKDVGLEYEAIILKAGEQTKRFAVLESVLNEILKHKPERNTVLIALGGGVIGDLTGFAASILLRGVPFIQIPTTLLAQVDSSVGGKTGINTDYGKNLVGSFYQPRLVLADSNTLQTLPKREFLAGYAEVVKYGLINNAAFFDWLKDNESAILEREDAVIRQCVLTSCQAKADIVAQDEREGGVRALLNLGHTFGHALEVQTGYSDVLLHGEAVAIGMVMAFQFSARLHMCPPKDVDMVINHLKNIGLPTHPHDIKKAWDTEGLLAAMYQDKKVQAGKLVFILTHGIGKAAIVRDVKESDVLDFLKEIL